jgi:hypothetical protein
MTSLASALHARYLTDGIPERYYREYEENEDEERRVHDSSGCSSSLCRIRPGIITGRTKVQRRMWQDQPKSVK